MKKMFIVSLVKNGILGGILYVMSDELIYCTNKITVSKKIQRLHLPYSEIERITKERLHTILVSLKNNEEYKFFVFSRKRLLECVERNMIKDEDL